MLLNMVFLKTLQRLLLCMTLGFISSACATWSEHGVVLDSREIRIAVLPVENAVPIKTLDDIQTVPADLKMSANDGQMVKRAMDDIVRRIESRVETGIDRSNLFQTVPHGKISNTSQILGISLDERPIPINQLTTFGKAVDADAVFIVTLSGYGKIKKKWLYWLIGSGVVEGVVQGVAAASVVDSGWVAFGVAGEEILQEILTWGGGTYLFNRIFTPVIIEGELISCTDGKTIWSHTAFARMHRKALKKLPEAERDRKEVRLELTAEKAIDDLLEDLNKKASRNIKNR
jgi:hypothetical protein